jgi:cell division protein FtsI (penicillin-binding protein 3)
MAKPAVRIGLLQAMLLLGGAAVLVRAVQLQLVQGARWRAEAERSRLERKALPARRGGIFDRKGVPLVVTLESYTVGIAPDQLRAPLPDARTIAAALGYPLGRLQQQIAAGRWISVPGTFNGLEVQGVRGLRGIYLQENFGRSNPGSLARGVIGVLGSDGRGVSGIERALDTVLMGAPGEAIVIRDSRGRTYSSPSREERAPVAGNDVWLTLDNELQEIAERALDEGMTEFKAGGGDIVILDPQSAEILALASRNLVDRTFLPNKPSFFTDPFEPGSTAKLFAAAALLSLRRVTSQDVVSGEDGLWTFPVGRGGVRQIRDEHKVEGPISLGRAIQVSSNIAMGKFSDRLSDVELYEALRSFGFGSPTGVEFPSESPGVLRRPDRWDEYSKRSIAMGYEFEVTPLQLATAYAAIANRGILLTPTLIRQIRSPSGRVLYEHRPEPVRRAVSPEVADTLLAYLKGVVGKGGTGERAQLANWVLVGKTGTAVRYDGRAYQDRHYNASFASIFPQEDPQLVVLVTIKDVTGTEVYGGQTAAPLTRSMLQEALAARGSSLDRTRLQPGGPTVALGAGATLSEEQPEETRTLIPLPLGADTTKARGHDPVAVPNVAGTSLRRAATTLHLQGFQVAIRGTGRVQRTTPAAGERARPGSTIVLWAE